MESANLTRFAWLSIGAAILTIALKTTAYWLTGSVGLLSDALESLVNLLAAIMALAMLTVAALPADEIHAFGYSKAEYFSSGLEGALILLAAAGIAFTAVPRLLVPQPLERVGIGLGISLLASAINFGVARILMKAGKEYRSITLEADAHHLLTDVWTSAGVMMGVGAVALTGWGRLDPIIALVVAANILRTGWKLMSRSARGLLDAALPVAEQDAINGVLQQYEARAFNIMRSGRGRREHARSFPSMSWCREIGLSNMGMTCLSAWNATSGGWSPVRKSLLTWNPKVTPQHGKTSQWIVRIALSEASTIEIASGKKTGQSIGIPNCSNQLSGLSRHVKFILPLTISNLACSSRCKLVTGALTASDKPRPPARVCLLSRLLPPRARS